MDSSSELFPVSRCFDYGDFNFYYPYGNTPAEDFLENVSPHSIKEPNILVLGCGDIRSCFYTLWKHFTSSSGSAYGPLHASPLFSGVHFVLNDHSAAVLARNIIFLRLCLQKPMDASGEEFKEWLCGLWAIWFSRNLLPAHEQMLNSSLRDLLKYAADMTSWASQENPLSSIVQFSSEHTLSEIRDIWRMWSTRSIDIEAISEKRAWLFMISTSDNTDLENMVGLAMSMSISSHQRERMEYEIQHCSKDSFAEYVVSDGQYLPPVTLMENLTMYASSSGKFVLHSLLPFRCFHHGFQFSPSQLRLDCKDESLLGKLTVADNKFEQFPLLGNSVQQFSLWLSRASAVLSSISHGKQNNAMRCRISFTFHCSDAIAFCNELQSSASTLTGVEKAFDVIYTSNLIDPLYPPNLVLFAIPLLKPSSYLFTTTIKYKTLAHTTQEYLEDAFGIDNKMLPLLFGIRCINHEGSQYKNMVSIRPAPVEVNAINPQFTPYYVKVMIWERVSPMIISSIPPDSSLWRALYSSVSTILSLPPDSLNASSSQTVVKMLQMFLSHVSTEGSDARFWDPLCSMLRSNENIQHLMDALQMHSMLSGVHLHLTVTSKTCPVCNGINLMEYVRQFCISVKSPTQSGTIHLYARINKSENPFSSYSTFDCLASHDNGTSLSLHFIAPLHFCESGYYASIVRYKERQPLSVLTTGLLQSFLDPAITYSFPAFKTQNRLTSTSFGSMSSHYGNGDTFESVIQLSDVGYEAYSNSKKVLPEQLSPNSIKLSCGVHNFELSYPHPVHFNTLTLTISRSRRTITIKANRACHRYEDETAPVFLVNPDNALTFPQLKLNNFVLRSLMGMQFIDSERTPLTNLPTCPPVPNLKNSINIMTQEKKEYYTFCDPSDSVFVMVKIMRRVFDYQLKAPAIDLVYCVTKEKTALRKWSKFSSSVNVYEINRDTIELMDKTFRYFSRRTICSFEAEGLLAVQRKVDSSFRRAVVYPLYGDADNTASNQRKTWSQIKSDPLNKEGVEMVEKHHCSFCGKFSADLKKCNHCQTMQFCDQCQVQHMTEHTTSCEGNSKTRSDSDSNESDISSSSPSSDPLSSKTCGHCHRSSAHLKKCSRCHSVQYCSKDCQKNHWKEHKTLCICCKQPGSNKSNNSRCSYCSTISSQLKRCTVCLSAQYCNKECQQNHWNEHRLHCRKPEDELVSQTKSSSDFDFKQEDQKCSFCSRVAKDLRKCTRCHGVQYCNKTCQQKHWPDHKSMCLSKPS